MPAARSHRRAALPTLAAEAVVWALLFFAPLALGSAPAWALAPIVLGAVLASALALLGARVQGQAVALPLLAAVPALSAALCLAQLVPLPSPLLGLLSSEARDLREFALVPLGLTGARPISLDPALTWRELAKHLAYLSVLVTCAQLSRSRRARRRLLAAVALAGTLVAVIGLGHLLVDARSLFGLFAFSQSAPPILTPFGNPNHLAGYLILGATAGLGLALSGSDRQRALLWAVAFIAMGAAAVLSLSRGGIVFFVFAQVLFAALLLRRRAAKAVLPSASGRRPPWLRLSGAAFAGVLAVLAVSGYVAFDRVWAELSTADSIDKLRQSKIELYPMMADAAGHFWVAGMGRGTFETAFTRFQTLYPGATFTHPENLLLQLASELGFLPAAALAALALWGFGRLLRRETMGVKDFAVLAGLFAALLHNLFDFNLELPACALTACVMLGTACRPEEDPAPAPWSRRRWALAALAALLAIFALWPAQGSPREAEAELTALVAKGAPPAEVRALGVKLIDAHPADYLLFDLIGLAYASQPSGEPREALAFVNRALYLRPLDSDAHRIAARSLVRLGKTSQALVEFRVAAQTSSNPGAVLDEGIDLARGLEQVRMLASPEPQPLGALVNRVRGRGGRNADAEALLAWALEETRDRPDTGGLWLLAAGVRRERKDYPGALAACDEAEKRAPGTVAAAVTRAQLLRETGKRDEAIALLQSMVGRHPDDVGLAFTLGEHYAAGGKNGLARETLARIRPFLRSMDQRASLFEREGNSYRNEGRHAKALQAYQSAARLQPSTPGHQVLIAQMYEQLGKYPEAIQAVRAGIRLAGGAQPGYQDWIVRLEAAEQKRLELNDLKLLEQQPAPDPEE